MPLTGWSSTEELNYADKIIKRTFSYKYENVIYEIFAPYAIKREYELDGQNWEYPYYVRLENSVTAGSGHFVTITDYPDPSVTRYNNRSPLLQFLYFFKMIN